VGKALLVLESFSALQLTLAKELGCHGFVGWLSRYATNKLGQRWLGPFRGTMAGLASGTRTVDVVGPCGFIVSTALNWGRPRLRLLVLFAPYLVLAAAEHLVVRGLTAAGR